jgi:N-acetylmuramoyl-L-alanine amidase
MFRNTFDNIELKQGVENEEVRLLQTNLINLHFLRGNPNGFFGFNTKRALEKFQLFYNLPITGTVDEETWNKIIEALENPFPTSRPTLKEGDEGVSVKSLEQRLIILDFLDKASLNGVFDENTKNVVISFQIAHSLNPDGVVGPKTWRAIDQLFAASNSPVPTLFPTIKLNDRNEYVELLQRKLFGFGYYKGEITGHFDEETREAILKLQEVYDTEPTGEVNYITWDILESLLSPNFFYVPILREGSTAPEVFILQEKLKVANFFFGTITGSFGPETTEALLNFQKANDLIQAGITNRETWETLFKKTAILFRQSPVLERPTLRYGDSGPYVSELQKQLKTLMFYDGIVDGNFNNKTLDSVKAFQINNKLTADGIVGRQTWSALTYLYSPLAVCKKENETNFKGVVIDAGHGGNDPGAVGNEIIEKEYTLRISQYMNNRFQELGIPVAMTRTTDETLSREERVRRMKEPFGDIKEAIVISNHINAGGGEGAEIIYALRNNSDLANMILKEIGLAGQKTRRTYQRTLPDDPTKDYYYIMRDTNNLQTTIVEYGFLDNSNDVLRLQKYWDKYAEATVKAVTEHMGFTYFEPSFGNTKYVVRAGDSLWSIANKFNTTVDEIKRLNNLTSDVLSIGQTLLIPGTNIEPNPPSGNVVYIVKAGDSLWSIANKFNTTVDKIRRLNNLTNNTLAIGQQLSIPGVSNETPATSPTIHTVNAGDSLYSIARNFGITVDEIKRANNLTSDTLTIGQRLIIPTASVTRYIVKSGDSLWSIANRFNTTVDEIKSLNNLTSNLLVIGMELLVPISNNSGSTFNYTVQSGDSLWSIANRFGTTVDEIKRLNSLINNTLSIGQILVIPIN